MTERIKIQTLRLLSLCIISSVTTGILYSQNAMGAKMISMGQAGVALPGSEWSLFSNSALLPTHQNSISFYRFRYAGIAEITDLAMAANLQTGIGSAGFGIHHYGFNLFSEYRYVIGFKSRVQTFHYGVTVSYHHVSQGGDYGSAGAVGVDIGIAAELPGDIWIGARATNINHPSYGKSDEVLPRDLALGFGYHMTEKSVLTIEAVKDVMFPLSLRSGLQVELISSFFARVGFTTHPETYSLGFGFESDRWSVNFGIQQHNPLGLSPALDLGISL